MAVINKVSDSSSSSLSIEISFKDKIIASAISIFQSMIQDTQERIDNLTTQNSATTLSKGFFYPNDYCKALTKVNQTARLEFFKKSGAFFHGFLPGKHFELEDNYSNSYLITNKTPMSFFLRKESNPSEALKAAFDGISLIGCGEACDIAFYRALLTLFGKEKFDAIFDPKGQSPLAFYHNVPKNPLLYLFFKAQNNPSRDNFIKGQIVGIAGHVSYLVKHPFGEAQSINLICIDDTPGAHRFTGLGIPSDGYTYDQVLGWLLENYNQKPVEAEEILSKELALKDRSIRISATLADLKPHLNNRQVRKEFKEQFNLKDKEVTFLFKNPNLAAEKIYQSRKEALNTLFLTEEEIRESANNRFEVLELDYPFVEMIHQQSIPDALKSIAERIKGRT